MVANVPHNSPTASLKVFEIDRDDGSSQQVHMQFLSKRLAKEEVYATDVDLSKANVTVKSVVHEVVTVTCQKTGTMNEQTYIHTYLLHMYFIYQGHAEWQCQGAALCFQGSPAHRLFLSLFVPFHGSRASAHSTGSRWMANWQDKEGRRK